MCTSIVSCLHPSSTDAFSNKNSDWQFFQCSLENSSVPELKAWGTLKWWEFKMATSTVHMTTFPSFGILNHEVHIDSSRHLAWKFCLPILRELKNISEEILVWKLMLFPLLSSQIYEIDSFLCSINMSLMLWLQARTVTYYDCSRRQQHAVVRQPMKHLTARLPECQTLHLRERNFYKGIKNCNRGEDLHNAMSST